MRRSLTAIVMVLLGATGALAQALPPPQIERNDASLLIGRSGERHATEANYYDPWVRSWTRGVTVGHYWTDHRKTEIGFSSTSEESQFEYSNNDAYTQRFRSTKALSVLQEYQFFRNAMFHPFVGAGIALNWERSYTLTERYSPSVIQRTFTDPVTRVTARALATAGLKAYFNARVFFRAEVSVGLGRRLDRYGYRAGAGFDF